MDSEFHLRAATHPSPPLPRIKPTPQSTSISAPFSYSPSDDGTDENILILLHGLGSHRPSFLLAFFFFLRMDGVFDDMKKSRRVLFFFSFACRLSCQSFFYKCICLLFNSIGQSRRHARPLQQTGPFFQASPDGHASSACTRAVRHIHHNNLIVIPFR